MCGDKHRPLNLMSWPERLETLLQKLQPVLQSACFTAGRATASVKIEKKGRSPFLRPSRVQPKT